MVSEDEAAQRAAREAAAEAAFHPPVPARERERRRVKGAATLTVVVLAVLGFASYEFVANAGHTQGARAAGGPAPASTPSVAVTPVTAGSGTAGSGTGGSATSGTGSASPAATATGPATTAPAPPPRVLTVASATAFGSGGAVDGDNPQTAAQALSGDPALPWYTDWYATPDFSALPPGTGLLLDLGRTVTLTSVQVWLGGERGATLELRAGVKPASAWLPAVASAAGASGVVQLKPSAPVHVRYVLVWFTQLPPDPAGTYQDSIYRVLVHGQP